MDLEIGQKVWYDDVAFVVKSIRPCGDVYLQSDEAVDRGCGCCTEYAYITVDPSDPKLNLGE